MKKLLALLVMSFIGFNSFGQMEDLKNSANEGFVDNDGVKIHYMEWGEGPLIIMLHGFPDFWYSWRYIIPELSVNYKVVAIDLRGYNLSDKPEGVENYTMKILRSDVVAVIDHFKQTKSILIANDWGGAIAWNMALNTPERVDKLIACNIPFPANIGKYIASHPEVGQYARDFQNNGSEGITAQALAEVTPDKKQIPYYLEAFNQSNIEAMLNYYKASYPKSSKSSNSGNANANQPSILPNVKCPVLMIYGLLDKALPPGMINDTWERLDNNLMIYTIPDGGHFIQQEKPELVNMAIKAWLEITD